MDNIVTYVAGFLLNENGTEVVLVKKNRPSWQAGKLNGVGGKIELGELPVDAMRREFQEECGVFIHDWEHYATLSAGDAIVYFFYSYSGLTGKVSSMTDESVYCVTTSSLVNLKTLPNVPWLVEMALSMGKDTADRFLITEVHSGTPKERSNSTGVSLLNIPQHIEVTQ